MASESLLRCPLCGREKRLDLKTATSLDLMHCGRVFRLIEETSEEMNEPAGAEIGQPSVNAA